jgi:hypothetical protein
VDRKVTDYVLRHEGIARDGNRPAKARALALTNADGANVAYDYLEIATAEYFL